MKKILLAFIVLTISSNYSFSQNNKKSEAQKIYESLDKKSQNKTIKNQPIKKIENKNNNSSIKLEEKKENKLVKPNGSDLKNNDIKLEKKYSDSNNSIIEIKKDKETINKNLELEKQLKDNIINNMSSKSINNEDLQTFLFLFLKRIEVNTIILEKILNTDCANTYRLCWEKDNFDKYFEQIKDFLKKEYDLKIDIYSDDEIKYFLMNAFTLYDLFGKENLEELFKINKNIKDLNNNLFKDKIENILNTIKETKNNNNHELLEVKKENKINDDYNLIFVSERDGKQGIYLFSEKTGNELKISKDDSYDYMPSVFPDKQNIIYVSENDGSTDIFVTNLISSSTYQLTYDSFSKFSPNVSPDGKKIIFVSNREVSLDQTNTVLKVNYKIYSMNIDGTEITKLTNGDYSDESPKFSSDGKKIVFVSNRDGNKEIYVMNADGSEQKRLTYNNDSDIMPSWSPDNNKIVFVSNRDKNLEIYIMNSDGSEQKRLTFSYFGSEYPVFSSDGNKIYFASKRDNNIDVNGIRINKIYVMNSDGTNVKLLKSGNYNDYQPVILK